MKAVFLKEFKNYFRNPYGYLFIGLSLMIMGFYSAVYNMLYQYADYYYVLDSCTALIMFMFPLVTMRIMSEETKNRTDQILFTSPISTWDVVMGKFLAVEAVFLIMTALSLLQPLALVTIFDAQMDTGMLWGGYIAFILMSTMFMAIGIYVSCRTDSQLVAGIVTVVIFILINFLEGISNALPTSRYFSLGVLIALAALITFLVYRAVKDTLVTAIVGVAGLAAILIWFFISPTSFDSLISTFIDDLAVFSRYSDIFTGRFSLDHIVFFLSVTFFFLFLSYQQIEKRRWA